MPVTIDFDCYYGDDVNDQDGDDRVRAIVRKHGGKVVYFQLSGPAGGNPFYGFELPSCSDAQAFCAEVFDTPDYDWERHVRPNGSFAYHYKS